MKTIMIVLMLAGTACSKPKVQETATPEPENAATRYVEGLQGSVERSEQVKDIANKKMADSAAEYKSVGE